MANANYNNIGQGIVVFTWGRKIDRLQSAFRHVTGDYTMGHPLEKSIGFHPKRCSGLEKPMLVFV